MQPNRHRRAKSLVAVVTAVGLSPVWGADSAITDPTPMNPVMDPAAMEGMTHAAASGEASGMDHGVTSSESTSPETRDPHAYADGYDFGPIPRPRFADEQRFAFLLVNRLEGVRTSDGTGSAYDLQGWYGRDYDRLVLKAEGDVDGGTLQDARTELLWGHAIASFWDAQLGACYDSGVEPDRGWLAVGIQGLAPYWFEIDATGYVGDSGRTAVRLEAEYELLFTQRLILQPRLEANIYGNDDVERALGSGLSDLTAGIRLRYEIRREIAPYIGVEWAGRYGSTADYARAAGQPTSETLWVAGLRLWY